MPLELFQIYKNSYRIFNLKYVEFLFHFTDVLYFVLFYHIKS